MVLFSIAVIGFFFILYGIQHAMLQFNLIAIAAMKEPKPARITLSYTVFLVSETIGFALVLYSVLRWTGKL